MTKIALPLGLLSLLILQSCNATVRYNYGDHRGYHCNRYNNNCTYRRGWYRGSDRDYRRYRIVDSLAAASPLTANNSSAKLLAGDYGIKLSSAVQILAITNQAENRDAVVKKLRIQPSDLRAIAKLEQPSREVVEKVAQALGERPAKIERILKDFLADAKSE